MAKQQVWSSFALDFTKLIQDQSPCVTIVLTLCGSQSSDKVVDRIQQVFKLKRLL